MPLDALRNHDDPGIPCAPLRHPERLAGSIEPPRRRRITAARLFAVAVQMVAGLGALVAALALVAR